MGSLIHVTGADSPHSVCANHEMGGRATVGVRLLSPHPPHLLLGVTQEIFARQKCELKKWGTGAVLLYVAL